MCECENFLGPMKFKFLFLFLALTAKCMFANGQTCDMTAPDNALLNWDNNAVTYIKKDGNLKDNATLKMAFKLQGTGGTLEFPSITDGTAKKYITATVVDQQLNLETNEQFAQYDEDQPKQADPLASKNVVVKFKCNGLDMALNVIMNIEDTNNHDPIFEQPSYVYTLPMPMVPKYDLTSLGDPIIAKDVDFSNQDIVFTITDPDSNFILETESSADSKEYRAKLTVPEYTRFSKDTTFTLTATDSGNPTRSGTTQITIKVDDSSSLPDIPTFSKASYKFQYSIKDGIPAIDIQDGPMTVTTNNPEDIDVTFEEDSAKTYLNAAFNPDTKEVTITSTATPVETTENILVFTLKIASKSKPDEKSDTVILIEIPKDIVINVPQFSKAYYTATYLTETDPDSIKIDGEEISVSPNTESVDVTLEGEKATKFNIKAVGDKWQLGVESPLDPDDLKKGGDIILTLKATVTGADAGKVDPGYATLVIQLPVVEPEVPPKFGQSHYIGNYEIVEDGNDVVNLKENITVTSSEAVTVTFESTYADYFNIIPDTSDPKTFILSVKNDLTSEILTKEAEILLTLQTTSDQGTGTSAVVISLPKDINPKFSKPNYAAKYEVSTDGQGQVSVDETITITSIDQEALTVTIQKSDYENYFGIDKDTDNPNNYKLVLKANLSQEILNKQEDIVLTLEAVLTGTVKGLSTVVISLPKAAIPTFSKPHYSAAYKVESNGSGSVTLNDGPIEITSPNGEEITVTILETDYNTYFSIELDSGNAYKLSVEANLPEEILKKDNIALTLQATVENIDPGLSTVVITLPKAEVVQFSKTHYSAAYTVGEDQQGSVTVNDGPIEITSPIDQSITITISEDIYTEYLAIELDSGNTYKVTVKQAISDDILKNGEIVLTLQAQTTGSTADPGLCTLVIALPKIAPSKFAKAYYNAKYEVGTDQHATVSITDGPIEIISVEQVIVTIEGNYKDYFDIELDNDPQITVKKNLEADIISKYQEIILTVQASSQETPDSTCSTVIALALPYVPNKETLKFDKPSYIFGYKLEKDTTPSIDQKGQTIKFTNGATNAEIAVKGTYSDFFQMNSNGDGTYSLAIKTPLDQKVLKFKPDVILTLDASLEGNDDGFATILLNLPTKEIPTPDLSQNSFLAQYAIGEDSDSITMIGSNITFKRRSDALIPSVTLSGTNSDHFDITYNEEENIYDLSVKTPLDYETLIKEADIVLTLKATLVDNTPASGTATLIIKLPKQVAPPSFSLPFYKAQYVQGTDKDEVQLSDGETINLNGDNIPEITVTLDAGDYADNFIISGDTSPYTITVKTKLAEDVLYTKNEIIVTLVAAFKDSSISTLTTKATVKIDLPGVPAAVTFLKPLYTGKYANDETATVTVEGDQIKTSSDSDSVVLTVGKPYDENFELIYDSGTNSYNVRVKQPLDSAVVDQETEILVDLDVETPHALDHDKATLLLKMPEKTLDVLPEFSKINYVAEYKIDGDTHTVVVNADRPIKIVSEHESETEVKVVDSYDSYFEPKRDTDGSYQIQVNKKLEDKILNTEKEIYVSLQASIPGNTRMGKAIIIVTLPINPDLKPTPTFSKIYYNAEYYTKDASIKLDKQINITSPKEYLDLIHVTFAPYNENFNIIRDGEDGIWNITVNKPLEQAVIDANSEITIELTATLDKSISAGTATLIIKLPNKEIVSFDKPSYVANYTVNLSGTDAITIDEITVTPSDAKVIVEEDYQTNFVVDCKAGKCTLTVKEDLSQDILSKETRIAVTIQATKEHAIGVGTAAIIIALPLLNVKPTPKFTKTYYTAEYIVDNTSIIVNDAIKIDSEFEESVQVSLTSYGDNFQISRDSTLKQWNIKVVHPLDSETLLSNTEITIELMGHLDAAAADAFATLLVKLPEKAVIQFDKPYYTANYTNGTDKDSVESEPIAINVEGVTLTTDGEYKDYFKAQCDQDKKCELEVQKSIPDDILESKTEILLVLVASMTGITQKGKSTVIIKLPDQDEDEIPEFSKDVYIANYIKQDDDTVKVILDDDDQITIKNISDAQVTVNVAGEYSSNFEAVLKNGHWELNVIQKLSDDKLNTDIAILVHLEASASSSSKGKAAVVIKLPQQIRPTSIVFTDNVYMAQYYKDNNSISIDNKIAIEGDSEGNATVTLDKNDEYAKYFLLSYKNEIVTVTMNKEKTLPDDVLKDEVAISVDIKAIKGNDTITTTLVVKLPDVTDDDDNNDCDTSGLIAGIAVLAVLLVAAIVGSAVFYYIKFRKSSTYENIDDPISHSERFKRNSNTGTKNKFEHPTRRPTGVIKYPIDIADPDGETTTEEEFPEKRKSVQFDTINIDELEIEPEKSDDDVMYDDVNEYSKNDSDDEDDQNSSQS